ncbi:MAG: leucine-rich repeat protein [Clostridia bacterium]
MKKNRTILLAFILMISIFMAGESVLSEQSDEYLYSVADSHATITKYTGKGGAISIPEELGDAPVKIIGTRAFASSKSIKSVLLPNEVSTLSDGAFQSCANLKSVFFLGQAPTMGVGVFKNSSTSFLVYYLHGKTGYSRKWHGYPTKGFPQISQLTNRSNIVRGFSVPNRSLTLTIKKSKYKISTNQTGDWKKVLKKHLKIGTRVSVTGTLNEDTKIIKTTFVKPTAPFVHELNALSPFITGHTYAKAKVSICISGKWKSLKAEANGAFVMKVCKVLKAGTKISAKTTLYGQTSATIFKKIVRPTKRAQLADQILKNKKIALSKIHPSGVVDSAFAQQNICDTRLGYTAKRSHYGTAPGGSVFLQEKLLYAMIQLSKKYSFRISEIAGASHSSGSKHYRGAAFDIDRINGSSAAHSALANKFIQLAKSFGMGTIKESHCIHLSL